MADTIWPTVNKVGGDAFRAFGEDKWRAFFDGGQFSMAEGNGFALSGTAANQISFTAGELIIGGYRCSRDIATTISLTSSTYSRVYMKLTIDGNSRVSGFTHEIQLGTTLPSTPHVLLAECNVTGGGVVGYFDRRPLGPGGSEGAYNGVGSQFDNEVVLGYRPQVILVTTATGASARISGDRAGEFDLAAVPSAGSIVIKDWGFTVSGDFNDDNDHKFYAIR